MAIENLITDHLDLWTAAVRPKSNAGRGSNSKLELTGIKKLRELILELAVRGKLVPQDPSDEPASALLERIAAEKVRLMKEGKIKKPKALPEISEEDKLFDLPQGWTLVRFGQVSEHNAGKTLDQGRNQGILRDYITTSNLYWGQFELSEVKQMPVLDSEIERCLATTNDLLICEGGEAGRAAVWDQDYDICFQNHIHRARFWGGISPYYMFRFFQKMNYTGEIDNYRKGVGISNMSGKALASILVPIPPIAEQHRIVAKIDELMTLCDQLEQQSEAQLAAHQTLVEVLLATLSDSVNSDKLAQNWARLSTHFDTLFTTEASIDALKQTILQLAVMGKLVSQDPADEPASVLLKRIAAEKARMLKEKTIKKESPLPPISEDEKLFGLPAGWEWAQCNDIAKPGTIITYGILKPAWVESGVLTVRIKDMINGKIDLSDIAQCSFERASKFEKTRLSEGDLLVAKDGATLGKTAFVPKELANGNITQHVLRLSISTHVNRDFIRTFVDSPLGQDWMKGETKGVALPGVNVIDFRRMAIGIPPKEEQNRIVRKLERLITLCDQLKSRLKTSQQTQLALAETLVEGALA